MTGFRRKAVIVALALLMGSGLAGSVTSGGRAATPQPSGRLAFAADRVTFQARPLVSSLGVRVTLFGSVEGGRDAGEDVKIQGRDCGVDFFRVVSGAIIRDGGDWSTFYWPARSTVLRAVWRDATSAEIMVRRSAPIRLEKRSGKRYVVTASGRLVWRKRALIQRFDRRLGAWRLVKTVVLTDSVNVQRGAGSFSSAEANVSVALPKGTLIRAVFPRSQTSGCYETGTSNSLRT